VLVAGATVVGALVVGASVLGALVVGADGLGAALIVVMGGCNNDSCGALVMASFVVVGDLVGNKACWVASLTTTMVGAAVGGGGTGTAVSTSLGVTSASVESLKIVWSRRWCTRGGRCCQIAITRVAFTHLGSYCNRARERCKHVSMARHNRRRCHSRLSPRQHRPACLLPFPAYFAQ
jgi:hypothetical protein